MKSGKQKNEDRRNARLLGQRIHNARIGQMQTNDNFSLRKFSKTVGISPTAQSRLESGDFIPGEEVIKRIAKELGENEHVLLAIVGKVSTELKQVIIERPDLVSELLKQIGKTSTTRVTAMIHKVRDGNW